MAMTPEAISEFEKLIVKARQKDLPFGLCLGKKPEDNIMVLDLKKSPEVLMRAAKQDGETGKVTCGRVGVKGKIMSLTLEHKMLPGLAKNMKMFLTKNKIKMKIVILDPAGNELESDGDDVLDAEDATTQGASTSDSPPPPPPSPPQPGEEASAAKWLKLNAQLDPRVKAFAQSGDPKAPAIVKAWQGGQAAAEKGNFKVALAVAAKVAPAVVPSQTAATTGPEAGSTTEQQQENANETEQGAAGQDAANQTPTPANTDPAAAQWAQIATRIEPLFLDVMKLNPPEASSLRTAWMTATESADMGDFKKAGAIATRLEPMLQAARTAGVSDQEQTVPPDVVPFQKSKLAWEAARSKMKAEVGTLVEAIKAACAGDEDLREIASNASDLHQHLDALDDRLDDALNAVINAPVGPQRDKAKQDAVKAIESLQAALKQPFFQDVDSNNGFKPVKVTETASKSLAAISKIISAEAKSAA